VPGNLYLRFFSLSKTAAEQEAELDRIHAADARAMLASFPRHVPGGGWLPPATARDLLQCYGVPLADTRTASDSTAAAAAAAQLGGPVVMKADVPGLLHKHDAGAVHLNLRTPDDARRAFEELAAKFGDQLTGAVIQPMITGGTEVIIGVVQEPVFGPPGDLRARRRGHRRAR
jgi:acyl-CoA synthetase (NDP forming)